MRVIARKALKIFRIKHVQAEQSLKSWYVEVKKRYGPSPHDVKQIYRSADIIPDNRVIFSMCGNKFRLIVKINYGYQIVFIRFIGTHAQYDKINAETI